MLTGRFRRAGRLADDEASNRAVNQAVVRAKQGDREALRYLYVRYADHVYGYVSSIVRDDFEAEDVTQHVFAKLMTEARRSTSRARCRSPRGSSASRATSPSTTCASAARSRARRCASSQTHARRRRVGARPRRSICATRSPTLPEEQRQVVVMRHLVGLTPGEIADRLGRTEPSIHGLHHRGRGALRAVLTEMECGPTINQKVAA